MARQKTYNRFLLRWWMSENSGIPNNYVYCTNMHSYTNTQHMHAHRHMHAHARPHIHSHKYRTRSIVLWRNIRIYYLHTRRCMTTLDNCALSCVMTSLRQSQRTQLTVLVAKCITNTEVSHQIINRYRTVDYSFTKVKFNRIAGNYYSHKTSISRYIHPKCSAT